MPFTLTFQQIADSEEFYDIETNEQGTQPSLNDRKRSVQNYLKSFY